MKTYQQIRQTPPKLEIINDAREVIFILKDCMDNTKLISFKRNSEGDFKINTHYDAFNNFQLNHRVDELEWEADLSRDCNDWRALINMINSGVVFIESVKSR